MKVIITTLIVLGVLGWWADAMTTSKTFEETTPDDTVLQLTSMICGKRPELQSCIALNETEQDGITPIPKRHIVTDSAQIAVVQSYIVEAESEISRLKMRLHDYEVESLHLGEREQPLQEVLTSDSRLLPSQDEYLRLPRGANLQSPATSSSSEKSYRPTASSLRPVDCADYLVLGARNSGVYDIYPFQCKCSEPIKVWCDMETDGGGWTVILKRQNTTEQQLNFTKPWTAYKEGFGNVSTEYWIGNEFLNLVTTARAYALRVDVVDKNGGMKWGEWPSFIVNNENSKYKLDLPKFNGNSMITNCLGHSSGRYFSTYDYDNDSNSKANCAAGTNGGFWYGNCANIYPTNTFTSDGILVTGCTTSGSGKAVDGYALQMKIRPSYCSKSVKIVNLNSHSCGI